jgi:hypothetical protein
VYDLMNRYLCMFVVSTYLPLVAAIREARCAHSGDGLMGSGVNFEMTSMCRQQNFYTGIPLQILFINSSDYIV